MPPKASSTSSGKRAAGPKLTGSTQPRLYTPPLRPLNRRTSRGYEVADFAEIIGEPLLPWQRWLAIHAMELQPGGGYRFRTVVVLVARQNGKSSVKRTISLWRLYMDGARLVLGAAQDLSLAREQWNYCIETIRACPDLAAELDGKPRNVNGDEWFRVSTGGRYRISASNSRAGRGLSVDELNIDELRTQHSWDAWSALSKTTMARPNAQTWCMSNAGDDESVVLNQLRDSALSGRDPSIGLFEWSAPDGCELDDPAAWIAANPGLGYTIGESAIRSSLNTDPPNVFRTEVLCQKVDALDSAIDLGGWRACADPGGTLNEHRKRISACFDVAPDGKHATLAVAATLPDGRARGEIAAAWASTEAAREELPALLDRIKPVAIGWFPTGPGGAFATILRKRPGSTELAGNKVAEACQELADLTAARRILQPDDPLLNAHVRGASKLNSGDGWRFTRKGEGHVDAAYAFAGAVTLALSVPAPKRARIRLLG